MTPENLQACIADAASAIIAGNRLIGRLNVESAIGSESESIDTWLMYAWTADDPAGAQLAIERAVQIDPENPLAIAGKTWIEGVKLLAESQVREREQRVAEKLALEEAAEALSDEDDLGSEGDDCEAIDTCAVEQEADAGSEDTVETETVNETEAEVEVEVDAEAEVETEAEIVDETEAEVEAEAEAKTGTEVEPEATAEDESVEEQAEVTAEVAAEDGAGEAGTAETDAEVESTTDDSVQAVDALAEDADSVENHDNSSEAKLAAARIANSIASVTSKSAQPEAVTPVSSLADDIRDSLNVSSKTVAPAEDRSDEAVADATPATAEPATQAESTNDEQPVVAAPTAEAATQEATEQVEESVVQDLEEMSASVNEVVQPAPAAEPTEKVIETPAVETTAAQASPAEPAYEAAEPRSAVVMIVDDSPTIRKLVSMTLSRNGFEVIAAKDGVDALKMLTQQRPDIILSDINMPRLGGYKLCRFVKKQPKTKSIPVLMLSGKDGVFDKMKGKMAGASGHITKPFESADLVHQVRQHLLTAAGV
jgi:twitching motility two-component system response regulator PilG